MQGYFNPFRIRAILFFLLFIASTASDSASRTEGKPLRSFDLKTSVSAIMFTPDGRKMIGAGGGYIRFWEVSSGKLLWTVKEQAYDPIALSPDGRLLVFQSSGGYKMSVWDVPSRQRKFQLPLMDIITSSLAFSPDGKSLAVAGYDPRRGKWKGGISVFDVQTKQQKWRIPYLLTLVAFSPNGRLLTDGFSLWDVRTKKHKRRLLSSLQFRDWQPTFVAFSPDGNTIAWVGVEKKGLNRKIQEGIPPFMQVTLFNLHSGKSKLLFKRKRQIRIKSLAYHPGSQALAIGYEEDIGKRFTGAVEVWDGKGSRLIRTFNDPRSSVQAVTFSPDGRSLAWGNMMGIIKLTRWK